MKSNRILSIDIFRGLTIFTMVFVNDVAGVSGLPAWMYHMPADADAMSFVDVVFPAFLFIVGMAIPFSVRNRLKKGESTLEIWKHILIRTAGLLVLGFYMVNAEEMNREANLIPGWIWNILLYVGAILIWNQYPKTDDRRKKNVFLGLKILGGGILLALIPLFRKGETGALIGMTPSWWGILGLIGWAYLYSMVVYWLFKREMYAMIGILGLFTMMVVGLKNGGIFVPEWLQFTSQSGNLSHATLTLAGIILSLVLMQTDGIQRSRQRIVWMVVFGLLLLVGGYFLRPLYGISKNLATPTWALYSAAICCFLFPLIYWLVDVKGYRKWAEFLKPAGANPLLTYILPFIFYAAIGYRYLPEFLSTGLMGVLRSIVFSLFILWVASLLTKRNINLHL